MSSAARSDALSETPAIVLVLNWTKLSDPPTEEPPEVLPGRKPSVPTLPAASIDAVVVVAAIWMLASEVWTSPLFAVADQLLPQAAVHVAVRLALLATHAVVSLFTTKWFTEP